MTDMQDSQTAIDDYSTGDPRKHHDLYFEDGNFVMQVENAILNVHRSLLARFSTVMKDMLDAPNAGGPKDGTDEKPLTLVGDSASGWALLLGLQYARPHFDSQELDGEKMLLILPIAHKYCMEDIETNVINELKKNTSNDGYVDLMVASRIIGSDELHLVGLRGLTSSGLVPTVVQAQRIGAEVTHIAMSAVISTLIANHTEAIDSLKAGHTEAMDSLKAGHNKAMNSLKASHTKLVDSLKSSHTETIDLLKSSHAKAIDSLKPSHTMAVNTLNTGHATAPTANSEQIAVLTQHRKWWPWLVLPGLWLLCIIWR